MAFDPARPRESLGLPADLYPGQALVQVEHPDLELRAKYQRYGMIMLQPLKYGWLQIPTDGGLVCSIDPDSPYAFALNLISYSEECGEVPEGSYIKAFKAITHGVFDATPWREYLPDA